MPALAAALVVVLAAMAWLDSRMRATGGPGILSFEFAGSERRAAEILRQWGPAGRRAATWANGVDFAFLALYAALLTVAVRAARRRATRHARITLRRLGMLVAAAPVLAAILDAAQNVALFRELSARDDPSGAPLAATLGAITFGLVVLVLAYLSTTGLATRR